MESIESTVVSTCGPYQKLLLTEMLQDLSYLARYSLSPTLHVLVAELLWARFWFLMVLPSAHILPRKRALARLHFNPAEQLKPPVRGKLYDSLNLTAPYHWLGIHMSYKGKTTWCE